MGLISTIQTRRSNLALSGAESTPTLSELLIDADYLLKRRTVRMLEEAGFSMIESMGII
jgi:hypothetical protein